MHLHMTRRLLFKRRISWTERPGGYHDINGEPVCTHVTKVLSVQVMDQYDKNHQGQIDFGDFLRMFRHKLLDLQDLMKYMSMKSAREREQQQQQQQQAAAPSEVCRIFKQDAHVLSLV